MSPRLRTFALTVHVTTSVGWLGAVAAFLSLGLVGLISEDAQTARGAHIAAAIVTRYVIVPLCLASLLTGVIQSLGTPWGLLRHYWVLAKLALTVVATALLLLHVQPIDHLARVAADAATSTAGLDQVRIRLVVDAVAAILVLLATTALAMYKPRGVTRYGQRRQRRAVDAGVARGANGRSTP